MRGQFSVWGLFKDKPEASISCKVKPSQYHILFHELFPHRRNRTLGPVLVGRGLEPGSPPTPRLAQHGAQPLRLLLLPPTSPAAPTRETENRCQRTPFRSSRSCGRDGSDEPGPAAVDSTALDGMEASPAAPGLPPRPRSRPRSRWPLSGTAAATEP